MAASAWLVHDTIKLYIAEPGTGAGTQVNFETDTFKVALFLAGSALATNRATVVGYADAASGGFEHANQSGLGYLTTGQVLANPVASQPTASVVKFTTDNAVWTAVGGSITASFAAIYDDTFTTPTADPIVCSCILNDTGGGAGTPVTATETNTFTIAMSGSGVFTMT
jgi:hypothetical protein